MKDALDAIVDTLDCIPGTTAMSCIADGRVCLMTSGEGVTIHSKGDPVPWGKVRTDGDR